VLRVSNTGYRLLRCTARVEPAGMPWIRLRPEHDGRPFFTIEETDLPIELEIPERLDGPLSAAIVLESNGGTRRVEVRVDRPVPSAEPLEPAIGPGAQVSDQVQRWGAHLARLKPGVRVAWGALGAIALRTLVGLSARVAGGPAGSSVEPRLASLALVLAVLGVVLGGILGSRRGDPGDPIPAGFAGGLLGLIGAAVLHAVVRSVEGILGSWSASLWAVGGLWAVIGAVVAGLTTFLIPYRADNAEVKP
jgi:hypothetical protein